MVIFGFTEIGATLQILAINTTFVCVTVPAVAKHYFMVTSVVLNTTKIRSDVVLTIFENIAVIIDI